MVVVVVEHRVVCTKVDWHVPRVRRRIGIHDWSHRIVSNPLVVFLPNRCLLCAESGSLNTPGNGIGILFRSRTRVLRERIGCWFLSTNNRLRQEQKKDGHGKDSHCKRPFVIDFALVSTTASSRPVTNCIPFLCAALVCYRRRPTTSP